MKIKPLSDRVLIKPIDAETKTASGLFIPDSAKEKPQEGEVVAVGSDKNLTVKKGDKVIYSKFAGTEISHQGIDYLIMSESEILAIV